MKLYSGLSDSIKARVHDLSELRYDQSLASLVITAIVAAVLYAAGLLLAMVVISDISSSVKEIRQWTRDVVHKHDLSLRFRSGRQDELGEIGQTIDEFAREIAGVLARAQKLSDTLSKQAAGVADSSASGYDGIAISIKLSGPSNPGLFLFRNGWRNRFV